MVRTRLTLSVEKDATPEPQALDENGRPKAVTRALKKLLIDANPALKGDEEKAKEENAPKKVYHWRGAVYEMTDDTPQEWIEQEPPRYQKRKREEEEERQAREFSTTMIGHNGEDEVEDEDEDEAPPPPKRKRGRPRKHPLPEEVEARPIPRPLKRKREDSPVRQSVSKKIRDEVQTIRKTRSQGAAEEASKSAREKAKDKGYQIESISWADMMTGKIAVDLVKFCAVQSELRRIKEEYARAEELHSQLLQREQDRHDETEKAPPTPDPETTDDKSDRPDSGLSGVQTISPSTYKEFLPGQRPPQYDEGGRPLHWSLQTTHDMEGRAEYHIYLGKLNAAESQEEQEERIRREKALISKWERVEGGAGIEHRADQELRTAMVSGSRSS